MGTIHINTDLLRQLGVYYVQLNEQINNIESSIQGLTNQIEGDWQGVSRQMYENMFQQWRSATQNVVSNGEDLGRHLQDTATRFEQADQSL